MAHSALEQEIADAVRCVFHNKPRLGPGFSLDRITMESDGALLLEGEVARLAQKKLVLLRAAEVPGVTELVDRVHVAVREPGRQIQDRIAKSFALEANFEGFELRSSLDDGEAGAGTRPVAQAGRPVTGRILIEESDRVVTLNGILPSLVHKRLAGALAWRVPGVRNVINGIALELPEEDGPDQIEEAVRVVLDSNPAMDATQIKAGVRGRVVRLTGLVPSKTVRDMTEDDCWDVFGVDDVVNEIDVCA